MMSQLNDLIIVYLLLTSFFILCSKENIKSRSIYLLINAFMIRWLLISSQSHCEGDLKILFDWSPLLFLPIIHRETGLLTQVLGKKAHDEWFIAFERKIFPSVMLFHEQNKGCNKFFSEFLHVCYLSFFLLIFGTPLYFYLNKNFLAFYQCTFAILFLLLSCFMTHGFIPVNGPRNIFKKISDHRSEGVFFRLVHKVLADGSTPGTAFPSGHAGLACIVLLITHALDTGLFYWILPIGLGLILSTVYGRFHYVTDVVMGFFYALIAFFVTRSIYA